MSIERPVKRFIFCEHCGGDKPWARTEWFALGGLFFCSKYCSQNHEAFLLRMARKGKKVKV